MERVSVFLAVLLALSATGAAGAGPPEIMEMERDSATVDQAASSPEGQKRVVAALVADFGVPEARISALRNQRLGYGEITVTLALAGTLPGGLTEANIAKVTTLRAGPPVMGWGEVAKQTGAQLGPVVSSVKKTSKDCVKAGGKPATLPRNGGKGEKGEGGGAAKGGRGK